MSTGPWEGGKGSRHRKYNQSKFAENYERIFSDARNAQGKEDGRKETNAKHRQSGRKQAEAYSKEEQD
jgi:hypothetical protein